MFKFVVLLMLVSSPVFAYPVADTGSEYVLKKFDSLMLEIQGLVHNAIASKVILTPVVPPTSEISSASLPVSIYNTVEKIVESAAFEILEGQKENVAVPEFVYLGPEVPMIPYVPAKEEEIVALPILPETSPVFEVSEVQELLDVVEITEQPEEKTELPTEVSESFSDEKLLVVPTVATFPAVEVIDTVETETKTEVPVVEVQPILHEKPVPVVVEKVPEIELTVVEIVSELQPAHEKLVVESVPEEPFNEIVTLNEAIPIIPASVSEEVIVPAPVKQVIKRAKNHNKVKKFVQKKPAAVA